MIDLFKKYVARNFWLAFLCFMLDYFNFVVNTPETYPARLTAFGFCVLWFLWTCYAMEKKWTLN